MRNRKVSKQRIQDIKRMLPCDHFQFSDFFICSDFTLNQLQKKSRDKALVLPRQVGSVWAVLSGCDLTQAADIFHQKHCTIYHSIMIVHNTVLFPNSYPEMHELIMRVCNASQSGSLSISNSGLVNQFRIMDQLIAPVLDIANPSSRAVAVLLDKRSKQLGYAKEFNSKLINESSNFHIGADGSLVINQQQY